MGTSYLKVPEANNGDFDLKIIIAIGHPADVHFFRKIISDLKDQGHHLTILAREKEVTFFLLEKYKIDFIKLSIHKKKFLSKLANYFFRWHKAYKICKQIKPDISIGIGDFILPQISRLAGFTSFVFTDIESVVHDPFLTFPFASHIITPKSYKKNLGKKQIRVNAYKELAYANEKFIPDPSVLNDLCIKKDEKFVVLRFVSHSAVHDICYKGITDNLKIKVVNALKKYAKIFISSEEPLPEELKQYQLNIGPERIHSVLFYASLLYGESSTMAAESALMGTPAVFVDKSNRGYTEEIQSESGLIFNFTLTAGELRPSLEKTVDIIQSGDKKNEWREKSKKLISTKDDISRFMIDILTHDKIHT